MLPTNAALRSQVAEVALEISSMETRLEEKRAELQRLQHQLDAVTYPVLSLPPEITSEIFIHCLPSLQLRPDGVDPMQVPLLVSHVCSQWRRIAISTPLLWRELNIDLGIRRRQGSDIVDTWLARAQHCPLSVRIRGLVLDLVDSARFFEAFRRHAWKMQSLELEIHMEDFEEMEKPMPEFPLLRELSLSSADGWTLLNESLDKMFADVPQISQVRLCYFPAKVDMVALPWDQLQKFTGEFYELSECLEALRLMPNIVECTFSVHETVVEDDSHQMVSHSQLRTFTLFQSKPLDEDEAVPRSAQLLALITFPNLETLQLLDIEDYDAQALASFLGRGSPPLKRLVIRPHLRPGQTDLVLTMTPLLQPHFKNLEIWYPEKGFASRFFERLSQDSEFVPGLEMLSFYCRSRKKEASRRDLLAIAAESLNKRRDLTGVNQLRVFRAMVAAEKVSPWSHADALVPFRRLEQEGLDVQSGLQRSRNEI
ncbi:hypothetical protein FB45DRAFT_424637 [Roridomyces roridus]|uniref:F-box domain-containing protein n=1 Tax=Roridomyces roridus TaxID=1738132 RepID=A0AAD7C5L8_9AGAR|nr:hypothetical protein FB45DRAFT_424637 [Roridomyces roridus]